MTDAQIYQMLTTLYEQIRDQQVLANESVVAAHALHRAMKETSPTFDAIYSKHYKAMQDGPIGQVHAAKIAELDGLIAELKKLF